MRKPLLKSVALILALVISQWLVFAHAVSHPALALDLVLRNKGDRRRHRSSDRAGPSVPFRGLRYRYP